jgi:hypothetical protein
VKDRPGAGVNVVAAKLAHEGPALLQWVKLRVRATAGAANFGPAVIDLHQLGEARRVIRVNGLKLLESVGSWLHGCYPLPAIEGYPIEALKCCQGINALTIGLEHNMNKIHWQAQKFTTSLAWRGGCQINRLPRSVTQRVF